MERTKITASQLLAKKNRGEKIVAITAYDYLSAKLLDESEVDLLLVGDSLGMVVLGYENTLRVTVEEMLHHSRAVVRARPKAMVVTDMPFLSYQPSIRDAVYNAGRLLREGGAEAVKLEGGAEMADKIQAILDAGIPIVGHLGMRPQQTLRVGGYRVQGRNPKDADQMLRDAQQLEELGVLAIVLECVPSDVARTISQGLRIPTIGIGAGKECDGQILVLHDLIGFTNGSQPKFVKHFANMAEEVKKAVTRYRQEVQTGSYPDKDHSYER